MLLWRICLHGSNSVLKFVGPCPTSSPGHSTQFAWYKNLPLLGSFSFAIIVLVGSGIYFTCRLHCIQLTHMGTAIRLLVHRRSAATGISPLAAFMLSSAMRVGPGNILGVTGAISVGGPGALFWMWVSAFFGMATAFVEGTMAQLFQENVRDSLGGLPFTDGTSSRGGRAWGIFPFSCISSMPLGLSGPGIQCGFFRRGHRFPCLAARRFPPNPLLLRHSGWCWSLLAPAGLGASKSDKGHQCHGSGDGGGIRPLRSLLIVGNVRSVPYFFERCLREPSGRKPFSAGCSVPSGPGGNGG